MAAVTIAKYVFAFVIGFAMFMLFTPIMADLRYSNPMWDDMPTTILAFGDQIHGVWLMLSVVIAAIIVVTGISQGMRAGSGG